jgi:transcriptional regulator with XRE-family HTH domain
MCLSHVVLSTLLWYFFSNEAIESIKVHLTPAQLRAGRALLEWSVDVLAEAAGVHRNTVLRAENGEASAPTLAALRLALEGAGVVFIPRNGGGEGVRLAQPSEAVSVLSRKRKVDG